MVTAYYSSAGQVGTAGYRWKPHLPLQVVNFVGVLSLLSILLIRFILQDFDSFSTTSFILTRFCNRVKLSNLILEFQRAEFY